MTAELADGWLPTMFIPERAEDAWGTALARGRAHRASNMRPMEIAAGGPIAIGDDLDVAKLRDRHRALLALYRSSFVIMRFQGSAIGSCATERGEPGLRDSRSRLYVKNLG